MLINHLLKKESNSQLLNIILDNVHMQSFIGFSRFIINNLVSLYI